MRTHPTITTPAPPEQPVEAVVVRLADHAIGLWQAAEALGDPVLLEGLRPLLMHVGRALARDLMAGATDQTAQ